MSDNDLLIEQLGQILRIQFNRPHKKNALTQQMYRQMMQALRDADEDASVHCILVQGTEECFTAGNDLVDFLEAEELAAGDFVKMIGKVKKPLVAAVNGPSVGVGTTMLLHFDLVVAAEEAYFMMPFSDLGLCPEAGASLLLPRIVGHTRAAELLLLGSKITAAQALDWGMINAVRPASEYRTHALAMAQAIASKPLNAIMVSKALLRRHQASTLDAVIADELVCFEELLRSDATRAIIQKLLGK